MKGKDTFIIVIGIYFSLFAISCSYSNDTVSILDGKVSFYKPSQVLLWDDIPEFDNFVDENDFLNGKYLLRSVYINNAKIRKLRPNQKSKELKNLLSEKVEIGSDDLIFLLNNDEMVLSRFLPMSDVLESFELLKINNSSVGETFFSASSDGLLAAGSYVYSANIVVEGGILNLYLIYYDLDYRIAEKSDLFKFSDEDKEYYWRKKESKLQLYNKITSNSSDEALKDLVKLTEYWNQIIDSLKLDTK